MSGEFHVVNSEHSLQEFLKSVLLRFEQDRYTEYRWTTKARQRTLTQNRCIHLYCARLARAFNAAGMERMIDSPVLKETIEAPWDEHSVKEHIWRVVQLAVTGHQSTRDITTKECTMIYEIINRHLASKGLHVEWPHKEEQGEAKNL
jgi:hypothetical protein